MYNEITYVDSYAVVFAEHFLKISMLLLGEIASILIFKTKINNNDNHILF